MCIAPCFAYLSIYPVCSVLLLPPQGALATWRRPTQCSLPLRIVSRYPQPVLLVLSKTPRSNLLTSVYICTALLYPLLNRLCVACSVCVLLPPSEVGLQNLAQWTTDNRHRKLKRKRNTNGVFLLALWFAINYKNYCACVTSGSAITWVPQLYIWEYT